MTVDKDTQDRWAREDREGGFYTCQCGARSAWKWDCSVCYRRRPGAPEYKQPRRLRRFIRWYLGKGPWSAS